MEELGATETTRAERILNKLDLSHLIGQPIPAAGYDIDGRAALTEEFEHFCNGEHAQMMLAGLDAISVDHPRFAAMKGLALKHLNPFLTNEQQ